jgi:endoglucanase
MRMLHGYLYLLIAAFMFSGCILPAMPLPTLQPRPGAAPAAIDPFVQNQQLGRAINLGNTLEAPVEGAWGLRIADEFFPIIAGAGFDAVRIPIRWNAHAAKEPPYTISPSFFERVDHVIEQALEQGLLVVINIHHYEEIMTEPAAHRERFLAIWCQIAEHYQAYPPELLFELLNEPHNHLSATLWNEMLAETITLIRDTNPVRNLVVGPVWWNNIYSLTQLRLPEDGHLIVTVHYYQPFQFTHQGAEWVSGSSIWLGTTWAGESYQRQAVDRDLAMAARWGETNQRPIFLGEFGAYSKADLESRVRWTAHVARQAEALGMSWAYWEFASGFGAYNWPARRWRTELLHALIPPEQ